MPTNTKTNQSSKKKSVPRKSATSKPALLASRRPSLIALTVIALLAVVIGVKLLFFSHASTGDMPLAGDWDGNGTTTIGVYRPSNATFYLRNSNTSGIADITVQYGNIGDIPVVGDWDGNGTVTIGVYRPSNATFYLRNSNTPGFADITAMLGNPNWTPVVGDWDGNGTTTIGVYYPGNQTFYLRNSNTSGIGDIAAQYGSPGDMPISGHWNGRGASTIGIYRPSNGTFYLRNSNTSGIADTVATLGNANWQPVTGDWDANTTTTIGVYYPGNATFYLRNSNTSGIGDIAAQFGNGGSTTTPPPPPPIITGSADAPSVPSGPVDNVVGCFQLGYESACTQWAYIHGGPQIYNDNGGWGGGTTGTVLSNYTYIDDGTYPCSPAMNYTQEQNCLNNLAQQAHASNPNAKIYVGVPAYVQGKSTVSWRFKDTVGNIIATALYEWYPDAMGYAPKVPCGAQGYIINRYYNGDSTSGSPTYRSTPWPDYSTLVGQAQTCLGQSGWLNIAWW